MFKDSFRTPILSCISAAIRRDASPDSCWKADGIRHLKFWKDTAARRAGSYLLSGRLCPRNPLHAPSRGPLRSPLPGAWLARYRSLAVTSPSSGGARSPTGRVTRGPKPAFTLCGMSATLRPEAIDSQLVFHVYACMAIPAGITVYMWPMLVSMAPDATMAGTGPHRRRRCGRVGLLRGRVCGDEDPFARARGLRGFVYAHILFGAMVTLQWATVLSPTVPALVGWAPTLVGQVLLYLVVTGPGADFTPDCRRCSPIPGNPEPPCSRCGTSRPSATCGRRTTDRSAGGATGRTRAPGGRPARRRQAAALRDPEAGATVQARFDADLEGAKAARRAGAHRHARDDDRDGRDARSDAGVARREHRPDPAL